MAIIKAILFSARHSHSEIDGLPEIFSEGICPTDFAELDRQAQEFFSANKAEEYVVYVTGLTAATVAVIKAAVDCQVKLTLMHYDRNADKYVPQRVVTPALVEQGNDEWGVIVPMAW